MDTAPIQTIGIFLFPDFEELDAIGPWEVLSWWTRKHAGDGYRVVTLSEDGQPVRAAKGLTVTPDLSVAEAPKLAVLTYPGGDGTHQKLHDEEHLKWVRDQRAAVPIMASVCTGALVFAAAGLLANRPATTHWEALRLLSELEPTVKICPNDRFVDDGDLITTAGISAGIDMALHLVARLSNVDRARFVRRGLQYGPQPPV